MLPYSAVDIVTLMSANFTDEPVRRQRSLLSRSSSWSPSSS
jgi:hypothetical protein